jgi:hypothetical protein
MLKTNRHLDNAPKSGLLQQPANGMDGSPSTIQAESLQQQGELQ